MWNFFYRGWWTIVFFCSCTNYGVKIEEALKLSGENRGELEKVLSYYSQNVGDSLKLKSAIFLIENMPYHYSYGGEAFDQYHERADSIFRSVDLVQAGEEEKTNILNQMNVLNQYVVPNIEIIEDIKVITAEFLISHIESVFTLWNDKPWMKHLSFNQFCEYILPYRVQDGLPLENWIDVFSDVFPVDDDMFKYCTPSMNSAYRACSYINNELRTKIKKTITWDNSWFPIMKSDKVLHMHAGSCNDNVRLTTVVMRSNGVPMTMDFTPQWPFREMGHYWNVLLMNNGKELAFEGIGGQPGTIDKLDHKKGKVFRHTYVANKDLKKLNLNSKYTPNLFRNIFLKDVTSEYMEVQDVKVPIHSKLRQNNEYAWITHFSRSGWNPTHWGKIKNGEAVFEDMGKNMLYLPGYFTENGIKPLSYPFVLTNDRELKYFIPDTTRRQKLFLKRKYFINETTYYAGMRMKGGCFQASNQSDFSEYVTIDSITSWPEFGSINVKDTIPYQYWRYCSSKKGHSVIAEISFRDKCSHPIEGKIIGSDTLIDARFYEKLKKVFDNDPLTFFLARSPNNAWVGMDFGEPVQLSRIIYSPRTDDNNIRIGDLYELFYWDNDWISLGQKVATDIFLVYDNAPENALFWLRDLTRGKEERPFEYKDGVQIWW